MHDRTSNYGERPNGYTACKSQPPRFTTKYQSNDYFKFDYLKITTTAETIQSLAKKRLDTSSLPKGVQISKELAGLWASLNQAERNSVFVSLLTRHYTNSKLSDYPEPTLVRDETGRIIGLEFEASPADFNPGPKFVQVIDRENGAVDVKTKKGNWLSAKQNEYVSDYRHPASSVAAKRNEMDRVPANFDYNAIATTADYMELYAKYALDSLNSEVTERNLKRLTYYWNLFDQDTREVVWIALLTRSLTKRSDSYPTPSVIQEIDGKITGLNFESGSSDSFLGPRHLQIVDGQDGTVVASTKAGTFSASKRYN